MTEKVRDINFVAGCILLLKLLVSEIIIIVLSEDILQSGLDQSAKDAFNDDLQSIIIKVKNHMPHISRPYWPFGRWISKVFMAS